MSKVVYRYLRYGAREEMYCDSVDEAFYEAVSDIENGFAAPLDIIEDGRIVMDYIWIQKAFEDGFRDERDHVVARPPIRTAAPVFVN
jgi:hypothetical protein